MPSTTAAATSERSVGMAGPSRQVPLPARVDPTRGDPVRVGVGRAGHLAGDDPLHQDAAGDGQHGAHGQEEGHLGRVRTGACPFLHWR